MKLIKECKILCRNVPFIANKHSPKAAKGLVPAQRLRLKGLITVVLGEYSFLHFPARLTEPQLPEKANSRDTVQLLGVLG